MPAILVTYSTLLDSSVKYATDTLTLNAGLSLLNGRYLVNGFYFEQSRTLLAGSSKRPVRHADRHAPPAALSEAQSFSLELTDYRPARPSTGMPRRVAVQRATSSLQMQARDRYTMYEAVAPTPAHGTNSLSAAASWNRAVLGSNLLLLSVNFIDERGDQTPTNDSVFLRSSIRARFNKLTVTLVGSTGWRFSNGSQSRDDSLRFDMKRSF